MNITLAIMEPTLANNSLDSMFDEFLIIFFLFRAYLLLLDGFVDGGLVLREG